MLRKTGRKLIMIMLLWSAAPGQLQNDLERAGMFERNGDFESALLIFQDLWSHYPGNQAVREGLKRNYQRLEKYPELKALLEHIIDRSPDDIPSALELADLFLRTGEKDKGISLLQQLPARKPKDPDIYHQAGQVLVRYRHWTPARALYFSAREATGDTRLYTDEVALTWLREEKYTEATGEYLGYFKKYNEEEYQHIYEKLPLLGTAGGAFTEFERLMREKIEATETAKRFYLHKLLSDLYLQYKKYDQAFAEQQTMERLSGKNGKVLYEFAVWCEQEGLWKMCSKVAAYIIKQYPETKLLADVYYTRARCLTQLKQYKTALAVYDSVVSRFPRHPLVVEAQYQMGEINFQYLNNTEQAMVHFNRLLQNKQAGTRIFDALFRIGDCYVNKGDLKSAQEMYLQLEQKVRHLKDLADKARFKRAEALFLANAIQESRALLEQIAKDKGENLYQNDALNLLLLLEEGGEEELGFYSRAEFYRRQHKYLEARREWKKLVTSYPGSPLVDDAQMQIAQVLTLSNMPNEALAVYRQVAGQEQEGTMAVEARIKIGEIYELNLKDLPQAVQEYKKIIEDFPASPLVPQVRKRLRELMKLI